MSSGAIFGLGTILLRQGLGIVLYRPKTYMEAKMGEIPHMYRPSMVLWKDMLYILGGMHTYLKIPDDGYVYAFDIDMKTYRQLTTMKKPRCAVGAAASHFDIIVTGGFGDSGPEATCSLYRPSTNKWHPLPELQIARANHAFICLSGGRGLAIGGINAADKYVVSVEIIQLSCSESARTSQSSWYFVAPMLSARSRFGCISVHGVIIVAGGVCDISDAFVVASVEMFSPPLPVNANDIGQWTDITTRSISTGISFLTAYEDGLLLVDLFAVCLQGTCKKSEADAERSLVDLTWNDHNQFLLIDRCLAVVNAHSPNEF